MGELVWGLGRRAYKNKTVKKEISCMQKGLVELMTSQGYCAWLFTMYVRRIIVSWSQAGDEMRKREEKKRKYKKTFPFICSAPLDLP